MAGRLTAPQLPGLYHTGAHRVKRHQSDPSRSGCRAAPRLYHSRQFGPLDAGEAIVTAKSLPFWKLTK